MPSSTAETPVIVIGELTAIVLLSVTVTTRSEAESVATLMAIGLPRLSLPGAGVSVRSKKVPAVFVEPP